MKITGDVLRENEFIGLELYPAAKLRCKTINTSTSHVIMTKNRRHGAYVEKILFPLWERGPQAIQQSWMTWLGMEFLYPVTEL
jgi:hypothetical protein